MGWIAQYKRFADIWMPVAPRGVQEDEFATVMNILKEQQKLLSIKQRDAQQLLNFEKTIAALKENLRKRSLNFSHERLKDMATSPLTDVANDYLRFLKQKEFAKTAVKEASLLLINLRKQLKSSKISLKYIQAKPFSLSNLKKQSSRFIDQGIKYISRNKFTFPRGNIYSKAAAVAALVMATISAIVIVKNNQNLRA